MKQIILNTISDLCSNFLYYDRKEDEDLTMEQLNEAVKNGEITIDEMVAEFRKHLQNTFNMQSVISSIKEGDLFKAVRPLHGITTHKCVRIKKGSLNGADMYFDGWLIDEDGIMIDPNYSTKIG